MVPGGRDALLAQVRRGTLEFCVLALLVDREEYAFELVRSLGSVEALATSEGTIYPLLSRLRKDGLVSTSWQESDAGPPRRYYALTPDGRAALGRFVADWTRFRDGVDRVLRAGPDHEPAVADPATETIVVPPYQDLGERGRPR